MDLDLINYRRKRMEIVKKSIAYRILFILIFLTVLIALNTTLSGVTNTQVKLSADIMVESFLKLEKEQVKLAKEVGQIDLSIQTYILGGDKGEGAEAILTHTEQAKISLNEIESIADELSEKAMNRLLHDAYIPYMEDMGGFLQQAAMMAEHIQKGDAAAADESYNALETFSVAVAESEAHFQTVLNERIAHENSLIHSRITRSTVIVWSMAAIFIITVAVTFWLSLKTIITPLKNAHTNLSNIIAKLENNEGDLTVRLESKSEDEVGQIITGINRFLETLQNVIIAIKTSSNEINKSTKNISVQIGQSQDATSNISASLNELSAGMEEVSSMIQNIDAGAQEVLSEANVLADHAESNSNQVVEIVERADEILVQSNQSKLEMETVVEEIKQAMDTAIKNSQSVERIKQLTADILTISSQTDLLALNASIEASKAGEAGKGFAVVAEEVRKLSESTKKSATDIQNTSALVTTSVADLVQNANKIMSYITKKVLDDYDVFVEQAKTYKVDVDMINEMLVHLTKASGDLRKISTDMAYGIQGITAAVEESTEAMILSNENTANLLSSISVISDEVAKNREIVMDLDNQVNSFKKVEK